MNREKITGGFGNGKAVVQPVSGSICPICGDTQGGRFLCGIDEYMVVTCGHCGAEYVFPSPDEASLKAYYDRESWFEGGEKGGYQDYDAQTAWSIGLMESVLDAYSGQQGLSILDIGCGYGTHLAMAAKRGWTCFGVEISAHARKVAKSRLSSSVHIVESVTDLIPHEFDLVLMLDVIEHLNSPYSLFYSLFSMGAITPKTRVVMTTPNAGSIEARRDPAGWAFRHPPSHLVFYKMESLSYLLNRLQFEEVTIEGLHPIAGVGGGGELDSFAGLRVTASGSNFSEFIRERYVPGTWSKIAEYEHLPRYALARTLAGDKEVLDFGCGTGYGTSMLAAVASSVTGLDINSTAHEWAKECHRQANLNFRLCEDLGATLPDGSFDLVTCFEMIEHVDYATQKATISSIARLLRSDGILVISTPNPDVTKLYGENLYHLREMTEAEFLELLSERFAYVTLLKQRVRLSVSFDGWGGCGEVHSESLNSGSCDGGTAPVAFVALCSKEKYIQPQDVVFFDDSRDFVFEEMLRLERNNKSKLESYDLENNNMQLFSQISVLKDKFGFQEKTLVDYQVQAEEFLRQVQSHRQQLDARDKTINDYKAQAEDFMRQVQSHQQQLAAHDKTINAYKAQAEEFARQISALQRDLTARVSRN